MTTTVTATTTDIKTYTVNPLIATEVNYETLKSNQLTTANNVKSIVSDFVMPKLYLLFFVLMSISGICMIIVYIVSKGHKKLYKHPITSTHLLNGIITKNEL